MPAKTLDDLNAYDARIEALKSKRRHIQRVVEDQPQRLDAIPAILKVEGEKYMERGIAWIAQEPEGKLKAAEIDLKDYLASICRELKRTWALITAFDVAIYVPSQGAYAEHGGYHERLSWMLTIPNNKATQNVIAPLLLLAQETEYLGKGRNNIFPASPIYDAIMGGQFLFRSTEKTRTWEFYFVGTEGRKFLQSWYDTVTTDTVCRLSLGL